MNMKTKKKITNRQTEKKYSAKFRELLSQHILVHPIFIIAKRDNIDWSAGIISLCLYWVYVFMSP